MRRSPRKTASLSDSLQQRLSAYALAAGAIGASLLASTPPAEAKVVYTPTNVVLPFGIHFIDLNHDGINDVAFSKSVAHLTSAQGTNLDIYYAPRVHWVDPTGNGGVGDLKAGFHIVGGDKFTSQGPRMAAGFFLDGHGTYLGAWANNGKGVKNRYVGVQFMIEGKIHYGWARFDVSFPHQTLRAVLTGYAYETIPGRQIIAGDTKGTDEIDNTFERPNPVSFAAPAPRPATLGLLALGSSGLSIWKRELATH